MFYYTINEIHKKYSEVQQTRCFCKETIKTNAKGIDRKEWIVSNADGVHRRTRNMSEQMNRFSFQKTFC